MTVPVLPGEGESTPHLSRFEYVRFKLGTRFRIVLYAENRESALRAARLAFERVDQLDALLSDYRLDSELSRLNRAAGGSPRRVSPELYEVIETGWQLSRESGGAFDITVGPVVELWRKAMRSGALPPGKSLATARNLVGFEKVEFEPGGHSIRLRESGMKLDLGGIAKGYIADEVRKLLASQGIGRLLVDAGGDVTCGDPPPGRSDWLVALEDAGRVYRVAVSNASLASSGDEFRFLESDGIRYAHILDPRTGYGVKGPVRTAVLAPTGMLADAYATLAAVLTREEASALFKDQSDVAFCVWRGVAPDRQISMSPGFAELIKSGDVAE